MSGTGIDGVLRVDTAANALDSLETAAGFVGRADDYRWKWIAIAIHHALYSFCIAALHNSSPDEVLDSRGGDDDRYVEIGNKPQHKSRKVKIDDGPAYRIEWSPFSGNPPKSKSKPKKRKSNDR